MSLNFIANKSRVLKSTMEVSIRLVRSTARGIPARRFITNITSTRPKQQTVKVDSLCIPISPPYSIKSYIPSPTPLSRPTLLKLHKLAALVPPKTELEWKELENLGGLIAIMDGVKLVDTSCLGDKGSHIDGRIRERSLEVSIDLEGKKKLVESLEIQGEELLKLAEVTDGRYYVVRTPEGIRGKKKASSKVSVQSEE